MAWKRAGRQTYDVYVRPLAGPRLLASTGKRSQADADAVEAWLIDLRERGDRLGVLHAIATKQIALRKAHSLGEQRTAAFLADRAADAADVDLAPLLDAWKAWRLARAKGVDSVPRYLTQITTLFPERPWRRSTLTPQLVGRRLDRLKVTDPTRNRYRAALSAFCKWLVRDGTLDVNVARAVDGYTENAGRIVWYEPADAQRIVASLPLQWQPREAFMAATGADWTDCALLRVRDVNLKTLDVRCHGHKTRWRDRTIRITEAWAVPYVRAALKGKLPDALVFGGSETNYRRDNKRALAAHHAAVEACKLTESTLHDWRHTYAVNALRRGETVQVVSHQLGHANPYLVWTRYGRFVPNAKDYQTQALTAEVTDTPKREAR